jgi:hypothetical protein
MSQPYLFYSDNCANSKQIIETLKGLNKIDLFKFIKVETIPRNQIPSFLKKVPTLFIPNTKEVIVGKDIFGHIAKPTASRVELPVSGGGAASATGGASVTGAGAGLAAWGFEGSGRLTESYSDWNNPSSFANDGNTMYTFLDGGNTFSAGAGAGAASAGAAEPQSAKQAETMARMKAMEQQRKSEFGGVQRA